MKASHKVAIGAKIALAKITGRPRPFFVQYSLLNGCNAKCAYCNTPNREDPQLTTEEHLRVLSEFAALGTVRVKFLGGEPLMRPDIDELVTHTKRLGMRAAMTTNAFLIPKKIATVRKLDDIIISIDGSEEVHDRQRGKGSWKLVMRAIEVCAKEKLDYFLSAVVTKQSMGEIDWLLKLASSLGVMANFQVPQFNEEIYGKEAAEMMPSPDEIRSLIAKIIKAKRSGAPVLFTARSYSRTLSWPDFSIERIDFAIGGSACEAGKYFLNFEPNGDLYPCILHVGSFAPKNAVRDGVKAAWEHCQTHRCGSCYNAWLNENRAIFDLRPQVLHNFWRNYMRPRSESASSAPALP